MPLHLTVFIPSCNFGSLRCGSGLPLWGPWFSSGPQQKFRSQAFSAHSAMMSRLGVNSFEGNMVTERLATGFVTWSYYKHFTLQWAMSAWRPLSLHAALPAYKWASRFIYHDILVYMTAVNIHVAQVSDGNKRFIHCKTFLPVFLVIGYCRIMFRLCYRH